ncbi:MAG: hypothetical protein IPN62_17700 [Flavobacteriales bacterium]|nr:hypothetical protein [Flavobacteriales bacterium]
MNVTWLGLLAFSALRPYLPAQKEEEDAEPPPTPAPVTAGPAVDPSAAPRIAVDRFSAAAGTLMVRDGTNGLPAANAPINFDQSPFITKGYGPAGQITEYYNFDVQPTAAIPIWVFFTPGATTPVPGQLNSIDKIPGDAGYNDFWQVYKVNVPADYVANSVTSAAEVAALGYTVEPQPVLVNCPVVPDGSTATNAWPVRAMRSCNAGTGTRWACISVSWSIRSPVRCDRTDLPDLRALQHQPRPTERWSAQRFRGGERHGPDPQRARHGPGASDLLAPVARECDQQQRLRCGEQPRHGTRREHHGHERDERELPGGGLSLVVRERRVDRTLVSNGRGPVF